MKLSPISIHDANQYVIRWHRHSRPVAGAKIAQAAINSDGWVVGVAIIGRPVSRVLDQRGWLEVNRVATDGTRNACSMLYGWAARYARTLQRPIITYTRADESGASLRGAGWKLIGTTKPRSAPWKNRPGRASHESIAKYRWCAP